MRVAASSQTSPALLCYSVPRQLRPRAAYLCSELDLAPSPDACWPLWAWDNSEAVLRRAAPLLAEADYPADELAREPALLCYSLGSGWPRGRGSSQG